MHWKVKALSAIIVLNLLLLLAIGVGLLLTKPKADDDSEPLPTPVEEKAPAITPPEPPDLSTIPIELRSDEAAPQ